MRIQTTEVYGPVVSSGAGGVVLNLQTIENWPVSIYNFTGNGAAAVNPAAYAVDTGTLALPAGTTTGDPLWIEGFSAPFGSAPPDFIASSIGAEASVPARLQVAWTSAGTTTPFATLTPTGLTIDLANANYSSGSIRIGSESIDLTSLAATPQIVPQPTPAATAGLPAVFLPSFSIGNLSGTNTTSITVLNSFSSFATQLPKSIVGGDAGLQIRGHGGVQPGYEHLYCFQYRRRELN